MTERLQIGTGVTCPTIRIHPAALDQIIEQRLFSRRLWLIELQALHVLLVEIFERDGLSVYESLRNLNAPEDYEAARKPQRTNETCNRARPISVMPAPSVLSRRCRGSTT